ncbi:hypothetical protein [Streptomyces tubercidicus]|uniref:hypothetical protein n=1 Tax=Streptomyces tubercidicus TaxID=47759 RepID=UPI002E14B378|nr:hypothetical protein OG761_10780 [Streptomyces tubercidicus]
MNQPLNTPPPRRPTDANPAPHVPGANSTPSIRCPAAAAKDPTPCEGPQDAATIIDRHGRESAGCVHHCARLLAGLEGARVHPFVPAPQALDIYSRARELPPFAWEIGR